MLMLTERHPVRKNPSLIGDPIPLGKTYRKTGQMAQLEAFRDCWFLAVTFYPSLIFFETVLKPAQCFHCK